MSSTEFYFNFKGAILGQIIPSPTSESRPLPYLTFLATPLLPCGPLDAPVKKFTGNGTIGDADDHMTRAIHSFAHFSVLYSQESLLFCDLQSEISFFFLYRLCRAYTALRSFWCKGRHVPHWSPVAHVSCLLSLPLIAESNVFKALRRIQGITGIGGPLRSQIFWSSTVLHAGGTGFVMPWTLTI